MKKLFLFLLTAFAFTSCSSSDDGGSSSVVLLKKYVRTDTAGVISTSTVTYDGNKFATITSDNGVVMDFTYTGNLITKTEYKTGGVLFQTELYTYDGSERLLSYVRLNHNNNTGLKSTYSYNADGTVTVLMYTGNLTDQTEPDGSETIAFLANGEVSTILDSFGYDRSYTYDGKNNPYRNVTGYNKISWARGAASGILHNVTSETIDTDIMTFTYTYNDDDYPAAAVKTYMSGETSTTEFFYED